MEFNFSVLSAKKSMMKKFLMVALISACFASANASGNIPPLNDNEILVTSLGIENSSMYFNLKYDNVNGDKFMVAITEKDGTNLYKLLISDKNFSKIFKVSAELESVVLTVTNLNDKSQQKFEISNKTRFVENVVITNMH